MSVFFSTADLVAAIGRLASASQGFAAELNAADARLGDGDLGITLSNGWRAAEARLLADEPVDIGATFVSCAKAFQDISASSFGTLTATGLLAAAKATMGQTEWALTDIRMLVTAAADAMARRGKAQLGDKTVLDSLEAVLIETDWQDVSNLQQSCSRVAEDATFKLRGQPNKIGRARMFGDDSVGVDDPGMLAFQRMVESI